MAKCSARLTLGVRCENPEGSLAEREEKYHMTLWQEHRPTLIPSAVSPCQLCVAHGRLEQHKSYNNICYLKPLITHKDKIEWSPT